MKAVFRFFIKPLCLLVGAALLLATVALLGLNLAKFAIYGEYYKANTNVARNPGLNDGFVCQGLCASEADGKLFVSGYMADHSASRIYVTTEDNDSHFVSLHKNGEAFTGHAGGIADLGDTLYLASESTVYAISKATVLEAADGDVIEIGKGTRVNNHASFIYADDQFVYVGEFHDGGQYVTSHPYETPDGLFHAIVSVYAPSDLSTPLKVYSIRDKVQGICFTPDGRVVLSTSYGLNDSYFYVYNLADAVDSGKTLDGAPVYYLNNCIRELKGPAMSEGLDYYKGGVITAFENSCNKYIFGKFFFGNKIVDLGI